MSARLIVSCLICLGVGLAAGAFLLTCDGHGERGLWMPGEIDNVAFAASHIVVPTKKNGDPGESEVLIKQAYRLLMDGESFAKVARNRSEGPAAESGGFLGFVDVSSDKTFSGVVRALAPGEVSPPVKTTMGWEIVKRHSFEEGRRLERELFIPAHGIFVRWRGLQDGDPSLSREQAREKAVEVLEGLKQGKITLNDAMKQYVVPRFHRPDAFIAMVARTQRTGELYESLKDLKPGEFTGPVETSNGWGVLKRGRYLRAAFRHILIQHVMSKGRALQVTRGPEEARKLAEEILPKALANRGAWDELVRKYSDDAKSIPDHGSMGLLNPGSMPMGFEKVIYDTKPGEIYPHVIQSDYGYHILWRLN